MTHTHFTFASSMLKMLYSSVYGYRAKTFQICSFHAENNQIWWVTITRPCAMTQSNLEPRASSQFSSFLNQRWLLRVHYRFYASNYKNIHTVAYRNHHVSTVKQWSDLKTLDNGKFKCCFILIKVKSKENLTPQFQQMHVWSVSAPLRQRSR